MIDGIEINGTDELRNVLSRLGVAAPELLGNALFRQAELIMTEAKGQTPVDTGALRASGHVEPPVVVGAQVSVTLGFGGVAGGVVGGSREPGQYAIYVHEDLQARHAVGNAKFLELPMLAAAESIEAKLAEDLRRDLEGSAR